MQRVVMLLGMPRAATTFLYHHFDNHPDIFVPYRRKTNFFSLHFERKTPEWFFKHFEKSSHEKVVVDTETLGFVDKTIDILNRLEQVLDQHCRFVLCVREPGEWLYSLYCQVKTFEKSMVPFEQFISGGYHLTEDGVSLPFNYQNGDIKKRIQSMIEMFGERLLLIDYKEVQQDPNQVLIKIENFLELTSHYVNNPVNPESINASDRKNIRILSSFLRNPLMIRFIRLFPVSLIKRGRKMFDTIAKRHSSDNNKPIAPEINIARERFNEDVAYYQTLFAKKQ